MILAIQTVNLATIGLFILFLGELVLLSQPEWMAPATMLGLISLIVGSVVLHREPGLGALLAALGLICVALVFGILLPEGSTTGPWVYGFATIALSLAGIGLLAWQLRRWRTLERHRLI